MFMILRRKEKIFISGAVIAMVIIFHNFGILTPVENSARFIFAPIQKVFYFSGIKIKNSYNNLSFNYEYKNDLINENFYLKERIEELKAENIKLKIFENENKEMKELLKFSEEKKNDYVAALIIGKGGDIENSLIINRGSKDGIKKGLAVINQKGMIIGKIFKCDMENCHILLLNDNQSRIAASILGYSESIGAIEGEYGLSMKMNLIPQHIKIAPKDIIITSGLEQDIPYGLIIGEVNKIEKKEGELFQSANVQPLFPLDGSHIVSVILAK
ncbi:MAG: rod shape-determining protein MreC [bacterium]